MGGLFDSWRAGGGGRGFGGWFGTGINFFFFHALEIYPWYCFVCVTIFFSAHWMSVFFSGSGCVYELVLVHAHACAHDIFFQNHPLPP